MKKFFPKLDAKSQVIERITAFLQTLFRPIFLSVGFYDINSILLLYVIFSFSFPRLQSRIKRKQTLKKQGMEIPIFQRIFHHPIEAMKL